MAGDDRTEVHTSFEVFVRQNLRRLSRRDLIRRGALLGLSLPSILAILASCGGSSSEKTPTSASNTGGSSGSSTASAVTPAATTGTASTIKEIVVAPAGEWTSLDPTLVPLTSNRHVFAYIFDPLIHRDREGKLQPGLATSWDRTDDTTIQFKLRDGVTFHNGEKFDAESVKVTLDRMIDPAFSQHAQVLSALESVTVVDPMTVDVKTKTPNPVIIGVLADTAFMLPPQYTKDKGDQGLAAEPVGTGPYTFKEWVKGDHLTMTANPDYWGKKPAYETVTFRPIPEPSTRLAALQAGEIHIADSIPPAQAVRLKDNPDVLISSGDLPQSTYFGLRPKVEQLQDKRVRQAINYGVDVDAIIKNLLYGYGTTQGQPVPKGYFGYTDSIKPYPHDPDKAKALLKEAGYEQGFTLNCDISNVVPESKDVAQAIAGELKKLGITLEIRFSDTAAMMKMAFPPGQDVFHETFMFYIKGPGMDADEIYSPSFLLDGVWNYAEYKNPEVDKLIREANSTLDNEKRTALYDQLNQILHEDAPWLYLYQPKSTFGVRKGVDWSARPDGMLWTSDIA